MKASEACFCNSLMSIPDSRRASLSPVHSRNIVTMTLAGKCTSPITCTAKRIHHINCVPQCDKSNSPKCNSWILIRDVARITSGCLVLQRCLMLVKLCMSKRVMSMVTTRNLRCRLSRMSASTAPCLGCMKASSVCIVDCHKLWHMVAV